MVKRKAAEIVEVPAKKLKGEGPKSWRNFTFKGSLILYHILYSCTTLLLYVLNLQV